MWYDHQFFRLRDTFAKKSKAWQKCASFLHFTDLCGKKSKNKDYICASCRAWRPHCPAPLLPAPRLSDYTGCTVHYVDNVYDNGPILVQRAIEVLPEDDVSSLGARVFEEEKHALPDAINAHFEAAAATSAS